MIAILRLCFLLVALAVPAAAEDPRAAAYGAAFDSVYEEHEELRPLRAFHDLFQEQIAKEIKAGTLSLDTPERVGRIAGEFLPQWEFERDWQAAIAAVEKKYPDLKDETSNFTIRFDAAFIKREKNLPAGSRIYPAMLMEIAEEIIAEDFRKEQADAAFVAEFDRNWAAKQRAKAITEERQARAVAAHQANLRAEQQSTLNRIMREQSEEQNRKDQIARNLAEQQARANEALDAARDHQRRMEAMLQEQLAEQERMRREMSRAAMEQRRQMEEQRMRQEEQMRREWQRQRQMEIDRINRRSRGW